MGRVLTLLHILSNPNHVVHIANVPDDSKHELLRLLLRPESFLPSTVIGCETRGSREKDTLALGDDLLESVWTTSDDAAEVGEEDGDGKGRKGLSSRARETMGQERLFPPRLSSHRSSSRGIFESQFLSNTT